MDEWLVRIRAATATLARVPLPDAPAPGRPGLVDADRATWIRTFAERLDVLRGPGDTEPAVVRCADAAAARAALAACLAGIPRDQQLRPGDRMARRDYRVGITATVACVAETGSVVLDVAGLDAAWASLAVETHVALATEDRLVPDLIALYATLDPRGVHVVVTGSSRTADVEKIVVVPAHGPTRLRVLLAAPGVDWEPIVREA